jgi:hypothetical protein
MRGFLQHTAYFNGFALLRFELFALVLLVVNKAGFIALRVLR